MTAFAATSFQERRKRFDDALRLEVPDRVPVEIHFGYLPAKYCGVRYDAAYYDYDTWLSACKQTLLDFDADVSSVQPFFPGSVLELVDPQVITWPGRGGAQIQSHQYIDGEYMRETEYAHLISNPADFMVTRYMPRMSGAMKGFDSVSLTPAPDAGYRSVITLAEILTSPDVAASLEVLQQIGREMQGACDALMRRMLASIGTPREGALNFVLLPLHFGSEGFCSLGQFETFYWPTLRGLILGLIEQGFTPIVMTEGDYTSRLEFLLEIPKGKAFLHFDTTDMFRAKDVLSGHLCISGNVPATLLALGSPGEVREVAKRLIDYCGRDGGFVMSSRTPVDDARPENLKALIDFTKECGTYA